MKHGWVLPWVFFGTRRVTLATCLLNWIHSLRVLQGEGDDYGWQVVIGGSLLVVHLPCFFETEWQWSIFSGRKNNFSRFFEKDPFLKIKSMNFGWLSQWIRNGDFIILNFGNYFQFMIKSPFLSMVALATNEDSSTLRFFFVSDFSRGIPCRWPWRNRLFPIIFR